jgi:hypothetical protein
MLEHPHYLAITFADHVELRPSAWAAQPCEPLHAPHPAFLFRSDYGTIMAR